MSSRSTVLAALVIVILVFGSVGAFLFLTRQYEPSQIAVIISHPGMDDWGMGEQAEIGMNEASGDVAVDYDVHVTTSASEAETLMRDIAAAGTHTLILAIGRDMAAAVQSASTQYPGQNFALIGANVAGDNVASVSFELGHGSFLAGILAAFLASQDSYSGIVGILGAVEGDATIDELIEGFLEGVEVANATYGLGVTLLEPEYIGSFNNSALAESMIYSQFVVDNASVVFTPVRASMPGIRAGLETVNQSRYYQWNPIGRNPLIIAAETNLDWYGNPSPEVAIGPSWIVTSIVPRLDLAIYNIVNKTLWDEYDTVVGHETYGLSGGLVNVTNFRFSSTYVYTMTDFSAAFNHYHDWILTNGTYPTYP